MTVEEMASEEQPQERPPLVELVRKVMLAGIGAAAIAQEEAEAFIHRLIEKGEMAEKDGNVLLKDLREKRRRKAEEQINKRISSIIERMKIPTKADFDTLSQKISELSNKVDELKGK